MATGTPQANVSQTVLKAIDVLECIATAKDPLSAPEVAQQCGLSRPTAYRLLTTLQSRGYIANEQTGLYHLGMSVLNLSKNLLDHLDLRDLAKPYLSELSRNSHETTHLGILDDLAVYYVEKVESSQAVRMTSVIGASNPLHCTAMGKAILAFLPEEQRTALVKRIDFEARTPQTITDIATLNKYLETVREQGFAIDDMEDVEGIRCIGAPIFNHEGIAFAAISVSGPAYRLSIARLTELSNSVLNAAKKISSQLGYTP